MTQPTTDERCPGCQQLARTVLLGGVQAFCGTEDCHVFMWDPTKSLDELAADVTHMDIPVFPWDEQP